MTIDSKNVKVGDVFELNSGIRLVAVPARADKLDIDMCRRCIHGDGEGSCITKQEMPFNSFICNNNESFEQTEN